MEKMLIANDLLRGGGVEKLMLDLVWAWHDKYDITIVTDNMEEGFYDIYPENVKYIAKNLKHKSEDNRLIRKINHYSDKVKNKLFGQNINDRVAREKFDILIVIKEGWKMLDGEFYQAKRKYVWVHTDYVNYNYTYGIFGSHTKELECMKKYDAVVCVSEQIKKSIISIVGDPGNLVVKLNPIDIEQVLKKAQEPVVDVEKKENIPLFVTVGRLNYQKGFDLLLEACHMLETDGYRFEVKIVGAEEPWGEEHFKLYRAKRRLAVESVEFLGGRNNPYKYMKMADYFLSSSIFEGYSLVSQEAALLDIPLVLTDCSGVRELLGDSEYGIVMETSVLGIYQGMKKVLDNPSLHEYYKDKIIERKQIIKYQERIDEIEQLWVMN